MNTKSKPAAQAVSPKSPPPPRNTHCEKCGTPLVQKRIGRPRIYCSYECRDAAREQRFIECFGKWRSTYRWLRQLFPWNAHLWPGRYPARRS